MFVDGLVDRAARIPDLRVRRARFVGNRAPIDISGRNIASSNNKQVAREPTPAPFVLVRNRMRLPPVRMIPSSPPRRRTDWICL